MKPVLKKLLLLTTFIIVGQTLANTVTPTLAYRSQGFHGDRQRNVGVADKINLSDMDSWYGVLDISIGYMRSFREHQIARCLFGDDVICQDCCRNTILVQGSQVTDRDPKAWLADYFYLNCEYDGSFCIRPRIQNVVVDLDAYIGLDEWAQGMYFRLYGPINWTKWQTKFSVSNPDPVLTTSCSTGYFTPSGDEVLLDDLAKYFAGGSAGAPASVDNITFQPLKFAKMPNCDTTHAGFADLRAELGWNFAQSEDYHLGIALHVMAPTGNHRKAEFVMDPVVGNGNHWEFGGSLHGHYQFWTSEDEEQQLTFYLDAVLTHIFNGKEQRTFDLACKDNSRYMLATQFTKGTTLFLNGRLINIEDDSGSILANAQFNNQYAPVANLTTVDVNVAVGVQADITAMFQYQTGSFSWDLGYNFWGRTCERIDCPITCDSCNPDSIFLSNNQDRWALKGDARMFGFAGSTLAGSFQADDPQALSATQNRATIHSGTNATKTGDTIFDLIFGATTADNTLNNIPLRNGGVDNPMFSLISDAPGIIGSIRRRLIHTPLSEGGFNSSSNSIVTSIQPIFIKSSDVALQTTRGISHKIFTNINYNFDREEWAPFIGIGGSAEFGKNESCVDECDTCDPCNCIDCSLSQWSIWVKGGLSFN